MIPRVPFGSTGHESSRVIFGGAALAEVDQDEADRALDVLLEHGINHIDVAASYGDAELRVAPWLRHYPTCSSCHETGERAIAVHASTPRSSIGLVLDRIAAPTAQLSTSSSGTRADPGGALDAAVEAREEGLVRFLGITGHGLSVPEIHRRSLDRFPFDSVLAPYNHVQMQDPRYAATFEALAAVCVERNVALQTIKSLARRRWEGREHTAATWYEPLREQTDIDLAAHWVLGRPEAFLITTGDVELLPRLLDAAERYERRPSEEEMAELGDRANVDPLFS